MKTVFNIVKVINIIALCFIIFGLYGLIIIGILQTIAALLFLVLFPKDKPIYIYFSISILFFVFWNHTSLDWLMLVPIFLVGYLTYIIHTKKSSITSHEL
ncbi:hypothetical protein [uncultured Psychroserpens sp.]|uniref:hypothetical protein n=1 Tax=uncultured Psychroserpens sp. TaxID=255436 RepID=UPI0026274343|nr:hypothetical protein [uncultured Psychroserpens sp.]